MYRLLRSNGDVLYVGKAANLRKRVTSHFTARVSKLIQPEMLTQVSDVQVAVVPSALEAALLEIETIQQLRPPYNVQLLSADSRVWYATRDFASASAEPSAELSVGPVASEYSLRPLNALIQLTGGAVSTPSLRAQAVGVSDLWTPDEAVFAAGWAELLDRHPEELSANPRRPRLDALSLAKKLLLSAPSKEDSDAEKPEGWDAQRVARHVERAAATAYQTYRRARWLKLLHDCDIRYREPEAGTARVLQIRGGALLSAAERVAPQVRAVAQFDRAKYDWLRVLTSELKRIMRDGGEVSMPGWPSGEESPSARYGAYCASCEGA